MSREGETRGRRTWPGACRPSSRPRLPGPHPAGALASGARKCTQTINSRPARRGSGKPGPPASPASPRRAPRSGRVTAAGGARSRATASRSLLSAAEEVGAERETDEAWGGQQRVERGER